jgi:hypothetical protein
MAIPEVTSGDLITADLMNQIIQTLNSLNTGAVPINSITVPLLLGQTLSDARAVLLAPAQQLSLGVVLDTDGIVVDSVLPANGTRRVLMQMPSAATKVTPNTSVFLVVNADSGSSQPAKAVISSVDKASVPANQPLQINGNNFAVPATDNIVTFDGTTALINGGNSKQLFVVVPQSVAPKVGVNVVVTNAAGVSNNFPVTVTAAVAGAPSISTISPNPGIVGASIQINGSGFSTTNSKNVVTIDGVTANVTGSSTPVLVTVTVPSNLSGLTKSGDFRVGVAVAISNTDVQNATATKNHNFQHN